MTRLSASKLLLELIETLVDNFGIERVSDALSKVNRRHLKSTESVKPNTGLQPAKSDNVHQLTVIDELDELLEADPDKYRLVYQFYEALKSREVLLDSQDIRHFAQLIGIKHIKGKSRKDMIPPLVRFLIGQSIADLRIQIDRAGTVSERQRQQGFSILTDKLLGNQQ